MKNARQPLLSWWERLSIFAGSLDNPDTYEYLVERAQRQIEYLKLAYHQKNIFFDYRGETIRGKFVAAIEGDYPGTYMIVLKIASSRVCTGPCFVHLRGDYVGGIVVTGEDGIVGITIKVITRRRAKFIPLPTTLAQAA